MAADVKKILCAIDLSEHSAQVAEYAALFASKLNAELFVVYVAPTLSQYTGFKVPQSDIHAFVSEIVNGAQASMQDFCATHFAGINVKTEVLVGYASDEILAKAKRDAVDMIIMGTHGRKGIDRILFGSVAEKIVKNSEVPVLTIHPDK